LLRGWLAVTLHPPSRQKIVTVVSRAQAPPHHHGRRERRCQRFGEHGGEAVTGYELLELVSFRDRSRWRLRNGIACAFFADLL
jgi:hypothetical protein